MSEPDKETVRTPLAPHFVSKPPGPKQETARVIILPRPSPAPALVAARLDQAVDSIPRSYCVAVLGLAALIFLIQIWNYVVS
jgi:hypothetical protein